MMDKKLPADQADSAGSPSPGEPVFIVIGKLRRPHGLKGDMLMEVHTDFPERLQPGVEVYIGEDFKAERVRECRWHGKLMRIAFDTLDTPEDVGFFRNQYVYVPADSSPQLPAGEYYHHQLIGLNVVDQQNKMIGMINQILVTGANDVLLVEDQNGKEILLPLIDEVVLEINLDLSEVRVNIIPGLLSP